MTLTLVLCLNKIDLPLHQNNDYQNSDWRIWKCNYVKRSGCLGTWVCWESQVFWTYMILAPLLHFKYSFRISLHNPNIWFVSCCEAKLHDHIFIFLFKYLQCPPYWLENTEKNILQNLRERNLVWVWLIIKLVFKLILCNLEKNILFVLIIFFNLSTTVSTIGFSLLLY